MGDYLLTFLLFTLLLLGVSMVALVFLAYKYVSVRGRIADVARQEFEMWRQREIATLRQESLEMARREARLEFEQWSRQYEQSVRQDAIQRSQSVTLGKVIEHFVPYLPGFSYNPKDARFIGSPIDFVVFDGLTDGEIRKIVFVEVKSGASSLTARQRLIRDAVCLGRVEWKEMRPASQGSEASVGVGEGW